MSVSYGRIVLDGIEPVIYPEGIPIVGATLQVYIAGGTTPASIFADSLGATPIANPQIIRRCGPVLRPVHNDLGGQLASLRPARHLSGRRVHDLHGRLYAGRGDRH